MVLLSCCQLLSWVSTLPHRFNNLWFQRLLPESLKVLARSTSFIKRHRKAKFFQMLSITAAWSLKTWTYWLTKPPRLHESKFRYSSLSFSSSAYAALIALGGFLKKLTSGLRTSLIYGALSKLVWTLLFFWSCCCLSNSCFSSGIKDREEWVSQRAKNCPTLLWTTLPTILVSQARYLDWKKTSKSCIAFRSTPILTKSYCKACSRPKLWITTRRISTEISHRHSNRSRVQPRGIRLPLMPGTYSKTLPWKT